MILRGVGHDIHEAGSNNAATDAASTNPITEDREAYYTALHTAWLALVATGDKKPSRTLAQRLGLSPETIRTQLKKARKQAANKKQPDNSR